MGLMGGFFNILFGSGGTTLGKTAQVVRDTLIEPSVAASESQTAAINAYAQEFVRGHRSGFDRFMDGLNRVPRPAMALATLALFGAAMISPSWFAERMQGVALVPEPLWWLLGAIVSFYFGARHQIKGQEFQKSIADTLVLASTLDVAKKGDAPVVLSATPAPVEQVAQDAPVQVAPPAAEPVAKPVPQPTVAPKLEVAHIDVDTRENAALADWVETRGGR